MPLGDEGPFFLLLLLNSVGVGGCCLFGEAQGKWSIIGIHLSLADGQRESNENSVPCHRWATPLEGRKSKVGRICNSRGR
ncbi:hypothetical protein CEXT_674231 [Caerostris extrusa]|uniref:Secreted protein n=1 Tax=Caerostris extrusa TaxID=172846 RepID=A0AAV4SWF3_CAEEX|nr:hypothetical protein CEXT_674231 [Caerostris extrusa]